MTAFRRMAILWALAILALTCSACTCVRANENTLSVTASLVELSEEPSSPVTISTAAKVQHTPVTESEQLTTSVTTTDAILTTIPESVPPTSSETTVSDPTATVTTIVPVTATAPVTTQMPVTSAPPVTMEPIVEENDRAIIYYEDFKAMWISQFDLWDIYTQEGKQRNEQDFTKRIQVLLDNVQSMGFNTVILQIRPNADSMYPSDLYPMSYYVVGNYGLEAEYDPIAIMVEEAHERSLSIHAWINPLRGLTEPEIQAIDGRYAIRQWYDDPAKNGRYIVLHNGRYYLNPTYAEVRQLIIDGASEALARYTFDGLHMDDYFYPTTEQSFDEAAYTAYVQGGGELSLADFRREQINLLVEGLYQATKSVHPKLRYGISPSGSYDTVYDSQYADFYTWCENDGYVDYLCPQVYYGLEHSYYPFEETCNVFDRLQFADSVDLMIGMTFGKAESKIDQWAGKGSNEWAENTDVLKRCLEYTNSLVHCKGISVFCYQYFYSPTSGDLNPNTAKERENFLPLLQEITWK